MGGWLGHWLGRWLGESSPLPQGSLNGSVAIKVSASGLASGALLCFGTANLGLSSSGSLDGLNVSDGFISGSALVSISSTGTLYDPTALLEEPNAAPPQYCGGSGSGSGSGSGYILRDHTWVKATKWSVSGFVSGKHGSVGPSVSAHAGTKSVSCNPIIRGTVRTLSKTQGKPRKVQTIQGALKVYSYSISLGLGNENTLSGYNGTCQTLGIDEILILMEMAA